jgi:hypothetical protein
MMTCRSGTRVIAGAVAFSAVKADRWGRGDSGGGHADVDEVKLLRGQHVRR